MGAMSCKLEKSDFEKNPVARRTAVEQIVMWFFSNYAIILGVIEIIWD